MEWEDFMVFDLDDEGEKTQIKIKINQIGDYLNPEKVFLIINQDIKRIYLWKGARSAVRKRFLGSRVATVVQGDIMKAGFKRCKVMSVDQGEEPEEFLNVFGLKSMEVKEEDKLEDTKYIRNIEKEEMKIAEIKSTKLEGTESSKLNEIKALFSESEKILWLKSSTLKLTENWLKVVLKDKRYKGRLKKTKEANSIEIQEYEIRYVITNKHVISNHIFNPLCDFDDIPKHVLELNGDIALLNLRELIGFDIEESNGTFNVNFHSNPKGIGNNVFLFENLTFKEYEGFIDVTSGNLRFRAEIPEKLHRLSYIKMKK